MGSTLLLWFVNRGSRDDLREAHGSRDVLISPDEVGSRKGRKGNEVSQVGWSEDHVPLALNTPLDPSQLF